MKSKLTFVLSLLLGAALVTAGAAGIAVLLDRPSLPGEPMARPLPPVTLADAAGQAVDLASLRGRPLALNFWATWCPPCDEEMPALELLHRQEGEAGVQVVAVNLGESAEEVSAYAAARGLTLPLLLDEAGALALELDVTYLPTTFFVDETGVIRSRVRRALTLVEMEEAVRVFR